MSRTMNWPLLALAKQTSAVKRVAEYNSAASIRTRRTGFIVFFVETPNDLTLRPMVQMRYARSPSIPLKNMTGHRGCISLPELSKLVVSVEA